MSYNYKIVWINEPGERVSINPEKDGTRKGGIDNKVIVLAPDSDTKYVTVQYDKILFPSDLETKLDFTGANTYKISISTSDMDFYTDTNFKWHTASNPDAMILDASTGDLTVASISLTTHIALPAITTATRDGLSPLKGWLIMNGDKNHLEVYNGTEWRTISDGRML